MKTYPSAEEELALPQSPVQKAPAPSRFSCFSDVGCLDSAEETTAARSASATYTTLEESLDSDIVYLQTRKPVWNREIKHWVHNFGGRVRMPSNKNFLVVQSTAAEHYNAVQFIGNVAHGTVASAADAQVSDRVCIRHGQVCHSLKVLPHTTYVHKPRAHCSLPCSARQTRTYWTSERPPVLSSRSLPCAPPTQPSLWLMRDVLFSRALPTCSCQHEGDVGNPLTRVRGNGTVVRTIKVQ
jgi:hypothetical protein